MREGTASLLALIGSLVLALITAFAVAATSINSNVPYSIYNPGPRGYSIVAKVAETAWSPSDLYGYNVTQYYLVVPFASAPDNETLTAIANWVGRGGSLVVLDEEGYSNTVLENLSLEARIENITVYDPYMNNGDRAEPVASATLDNITLRLCFHTVSLLRTKDGEILAHTSPLAYADLDHSGYYSFSDKLGSYPLVVLLRTWASEILVIPDTDFLSNHCVTASNNTVLLYMLFQGKKPILFMGLVRLSAADRLKHAYLGALSPLGLGARETALLLVVVLAVVVASRYEA